MNILVAVNEMYLEPLKVTLYSLVRNNRRTITVYVLHFHIPEKKQREFISNMQICKDLEIRFLKVGLESFNGIAKSERYKLEANLRLAMLKVLPEDIERIMWLDADIVINSNIMEFYSYPDRGQYATVCEDMCSRSEKYDILQNLGMKYTSRYFNSGVMLFYMNNLRNAFDEDAFLRWAKKNPDKLKFPDQNALNVCLNGKVVWVNPEKYNLQLLRMTKQDNKIIRMSKVIHYNMQQKPWNDGYEGAGELLYWRYAIKPWGIKTFLKHYFIKYVGRRG